MAITENDPWASAPVDADFIEEPRQEDAPVEPGQKPRAAKARPKDDDPSGQRVRATLKSGAGYDAPWLTVDFESIDDAYDALTSDDTKKKLGAVLEIVTNAGKLFAKYQSPNQGEAAQAVAPAQIQQRRSYGPPPGAQQAPPGSPDCPPGWTFKSGVNSKTGKPWQAYFPPEGR